MSRIQGILSQLYNENYIPKYDMIYLLENLDEGSREQLFDCARKIRSKYYENKVFMRGLIEFSNICSRNCIYCGIRAANENVDRYRLSKDEILSCCKEGYELGYRTFVLQSGEDRWYTASKVADLVSSIKELFPDVAVTLSLGERSYEEYKLWYEAGADRYLLRHETASRNLYEKLHPDGDFDNRRQCLYNLREIGYQVGAGFMVGLPGQSHYDLVEDLYFLKELKPHMIGIGPFIPANSTPLAKEKAGRVEDVLVMLALTRLMIPESLLPATTAMGTLDPRGREKALMAGANVVMPNLSPIATKSKYQLYDNKICTGDESAHCRMCIEKRINSTGMKVDMGRGDSLIA
ncbi:MAG: [FeFe] hydrogenase H-cluster radical SAM maturase HydE [Caldicoprobacterales bacterium]|jgi:biotin synthase|nr:[FeFe] hydrogenase H-cluster radical SAM maturase HydE [Clostridiales bacterium]